MIRKFDKSDLNKCVALLIDTYDCDPWNNKWTKESGTRYLGEISDLKRFVGFVFEKDGEILGATFCAEQVWWSGDELYVYELYVSNKHHGEGIGKALINALEDHVQKRSLEGITLLTNKKVPAPGFYEKLGFKRAENVVYYYRDRLK